MWLFSDKGFISITLDRTRSDQDVLKVRARVRADLERVLPYFPSETQIVDDEGTDYPYRLIVTKEQMSIAAALMVMDIDYNNFKNIVHTRLGDKRASPLHRIWSLMVEQEEPGTYQQWQTKKNAKYPPTVPADDQLRLNEWHYAANGHWDGRTGTRVYPGERGSGHDFSEFGRYYDEEVSSRENDDVPPQAGRKKKRGKRRPLSDLF
jgi:hypothetical protein